MTKLKKIVIDGIEYLPESKASPKAKKLKGMKYVIVRTFSAGVFAGYLKKKEGKEVTLINARRLWQWHGAASLSQLAMKGVSQPDKCKFPCEVDNIVLTEAIEIIGVTKKAQESIKGVKIWQS